MEFPLSLPDAFILALHDLGLVFGGEGQVRNVVGRAGRKKPTRGLDDLFGHADIETLARFDHAIKPVLAIELDEQERHRLAALVLEAEAAVSLRPFRARLEMKPGIA